MAEDVNRKKIVTGIVSGAEYESKTFGGTFDPVKIFNEVDSLKRGIEELEKSAKRIKDEQRKTLNFMMVIIVGVIIALIITVIPLTMDYFRYNYARYENFTKSVDNLTTRVEILEKIIYRKENP